MNGIDLESEFTSRAVPYTGGLLLLTPDDALALVRRAAHLGIPVLGVDGMFLSEQGTESPIEHIADFSAAVAQGDGCWGPAYAFIEERRSLGMVFEVVLGESKLPAAKRIVASDGGAQRSAPASSTLWYRSRRRCAS